MHMSIYACKETIISMFACMFNNVDSHNNCAYTLLNHKVVKSLLCTYVYIYIGVETNFKVGGLTM